MNSHHTKLKGDLGLHLVMIELVRRGIGVSLPVSEHLPYDLIIDIDGKLYKVQVKARSKESKNKRHEGKIEVPLGGSFGERGGSRRYRYESNAFDILAINCIENEEIYWLGSDDLDEYFAKKVDIPIITLRIDPPKKKSNKPIRMAQDYTFERMLEQLK